MKIKTREHKQMDFINKHREGIINEYLNNSDAIGFVKIIANNDFDIMGEIRFQKENFEHTNFKKVLKNPEPKKGTIIKDAINIFYEVLWFDNKTKWQIKELILSN